MSKILTRMMILVLCFITVSACSSARESNNFKINEVDDSYKFIKNQLVAIIEAEIKSKYEVVDEIVFSDLYDKDKNGFSKFYFSDEKKELYEGIAYYSKHGNN